MTIHQKYDTCNYQENDWFNTVGISLAGRRQTTEAAAGKPRYQGRQMTTTTSALDAVAPVLVRAGTRLGPVHIAVTDAEQALGVWRDLVGLTVDGGPSTQALFRSGSQRIAVEGGSPVADALIVSPASP
jgi:hypothetical protein